MRIDVVYKTIVRALRRYMVNEMAKALRIASIQKNQLIGDKLYSAVSKYISRLFSRTSDRKDFESK